MKYTDFKVVLWAEQTDSDDNDVITKQELTSSMRTLCIEGVYLIVHISCNVRPYKIRLLS